MSFSQIGKLVAPFLNILYVYCAFEESAEAAFYFGSLCNHSDLHLSPHSISGLRMLTEIYLLFYKKLLMDSTQSPWWRLVTRILKQQRILSYWVYLALLCATEPCHTHVDNSWSIPFVWRASTKICHYLLALQRKETTNGECHSCFYLNSLINVSFLIG